MKSAHLTQSQRARLREQLPWYVNGTLAEPERTALRELIGYDLQTRREWHETRALAEFVASERTLCQELGLRRLRELIAPPAPRRPAWRWAAVILLPVLGLAGYAWHLLGTESFTTLSDPAPAVAVDVLRLRVQLDPATAQADLAAALEPFGARIVEGPEAPGLYTIELPPAQRAAAERRLVERFDPAYIGPAAY
jgi:hypothetical protein